MISIPKRLLEKKQSNYAKIKPLEKELGLKLSLVTKDFYESNPKLQEMYKENDEIRKEEMAFREKLKEVFKKVKKGSVVSGNTRNRAFYGEVTNLYNIGVCFDISDKSRNDGRPFTIGDSCIESFEIIKE